LPTYPVVILLHGTDGKLSGASYTWKSFLPTLGVATLALDSYTGRGLAMVSFNQQSFGQFQQTYDAFRAVEAIATHPRIKPDHIALMGFSRGGQAALYTAMSRFQKAFGPKQGLIAAHIAFYPACNVELVSAYDVGPAPIRGFHGEADDWTRAETCRDHFTQLASAGHDAVFTGYPGARHGFDNEFAEMLEIASGAESSRDCRRAEVGGHIVNADTGAPFTYDDACVAHGTTVQYNPEAATRARAPVEALLTEIFALR
jgi:dienelactone hydrolase